MISRRNRSRKGFTLVEILVVVLIIGILVALSAPNLLGSRHRAADRTAQQSLTQARSAIKTVSSDYDSFESLTVEKLAKTEPNIDWAVTSVEETKNERPVAFGVDATTDQIATLTTIGGDGQCWAIRVHLDAAADQFGTFRATGSDNTCTVAAANTALGTTVSRSFPERP